MQNPEQIDLRAEQEKTLSSPVLPANLILRGMYISMDILYGAAPTLPKMRTIEVLARYPYWAWEIGSYLRLTRLFTRAETPARPPVDAALRHIAMGRTAQDNEQCHLLIIDELMQQRGIKTGILKRAILPRLMALGYYVLTRVMYRMKPEWSFLMNAKFESHAEHEYMKAVRDNPSWEQEPAETQYFDLYPRQATLADLFRRIGLDEREHMQNSLDEYERLTGRRGDS